MMLASRHPYPYHQQQQQQQQQQPAWASQGSSRRWATSLRERLQPRRTAAGRRASRLVDATWCPWNGAIYRSINRWHNSWTLLDNPLHLDDDLLLADETTDYNGETDRRTDAQTDANRKLEKNGEIN